MRGFVTLAEHRQAVDRAERLEAEVAFLKSELGIKVDAERRNRLRRAFKVTPQEAGVLVALYTAKRNTVSTALLDELAAPLDGASERDPKIVQVMVSKLRSRLGKNAIKNIWGFGFQLTPAGVAVLEPHMKGEEPGEVAA